MKVTKLIFKNRQQKRAFNSLENAYRFILNLFEKFGDNGLPSSLKLEDGSILDFDWCFFHAAFDDGRISEEELIHILNTGTESVENSI